MRPLVVGRGGGGGAVAAGGRRPAAAQGSKEGFPRCELRLISRGKCCWILLYVTLKNNKHSLPPLPVIVVRRLVGMALFELGMFCWLLLVTGRVKSKLTVPAPMLHPAVNNFKPEMRAKT